jgi:pimeloyl-ACP methyl ester carboxylesterase
MGWGAVIAQVLLNRMRAPVARLLLCDLPLDFSPLSDPVIARAAADVGLSFATREEAARHVLASPEFVSIKDGDPALVVHRVRAADGRFRLNHDDGIVARLGGFAGRNFDIAQLLRKPAAQTLLLYGRTLDEASGAAVDRLRATARIDCIDGLTPSGPLLLRSTPELLIALGFIAHRLPDQSA